MSILIDSADLKHIESACKLGWVKGVTTNPLLVAQSKVSPKALFSELKALTPGPIYYQLMASNFEEMLDEAYLVRDILEQQLVIKLPPSDLGFRICSQLSTKIACCPTAIYSPAQALIAVESGAQYIAVYVNRATRLMGDGIQLVRDISAVLANSVTEMVAASLKSPGEAVSAFTAGAHHLTLPHDTLSQMSEHELSNEAVRQFQKDGIGL